MSRSTIRNQIFLDSAGQGTGNYQYPSPIQTGTWIGPPINIDEHRRVSITVAITQATGVQTGTAYADCGGYTGTLVIQGTDELAQGNFASGSPYYGARTPGVGPSGGIAWQTIPSGTYAVTKASQVFSLNFTDVGFAYIRPAFNVTGGVTGVFAPSATGCLGGSGTWNVWVTGKST
jgi:hypothetical protein